MANLERIQANNALIQNCIDKANSLPNAGSGGGGSEFLKKLAEGTLTEIKAEDLQGVTKLKYSFLAGYEDLTNITFADTITEIDDYCTAECPLSSVTFGKNISRIGNEAIWAWFLEVIDLTACSIPPAIEEDSFFGLESSCEIRVKSTLVDAFKNATNWSVYADQIVGV